MIKYKAIDIAIIQLIDVFVGPKLSRITLSENVSSNRPSILKDFRNASKQKYPFVTFNVRDAGNISDNNRFEYYDNQRGYVVGNRRRLFIKLCCYADMNKAKEIISELYTAFDRTSTKDKLNTLVPELSVTRLLDIKEITSQFGNEYIHECTFQLMCEYLNEDVDPFVEAIDSVDLHTCIYRSENSSNNPDWCLDINIQPTPEN